MPSRKLIPCDYHEEGCTDPECRIGLCMQHQRRSAAELVAEAARQHEIDVEARKMAPIYFRGKGIRHPSDQQVLKFVQNPTVREHAKKRLAEFASFISLKR